MPVPISTDLRLRVVDEYENGDESFVEVGVRFKVGEASVSR
jgi:hypothetical protein